ncbi:MAG TPA: S41 family peptidase [Smithellaceae bacterium]|nr:S41 family peptidase [Smithellaceae bacterium]
MKERIAKWPLWGVALLVLFVLLGPYCLDKVSARDKTVYKEIKTFNEILDLVQKNYVDEVDATELMQGAINGMIRTLDPHSAYMTPDMYKELEVETQGQFGGIGIEITILKDVLTVVSPIENTPAFKAGVKPGDQIIKINGESTKDITIIEAVKKLRGPKNTKVTITITRETLPQPKDITLTRDVIQIRTVRFDVYEQSIGYLRIASFHERTADDVRKALRDLEAKAKPLKGLVLDLRNDPGGLLTQAIEVSDLFLTSGVIVSTRGRQAAMETKAEAKNSGSAEVTVPMVVIVNEGTASAAEIVAGALQDNRRAVVIGTQTFGKASVQTVIPLDDGSALKLTTARYYTPSGRSIQAEGIKPDVVVKPMKMIEDTHDAFEDRLREKDLKGHIQPDAPEGAPKPEQEDAPLGQPQEWMMDYQLKTAVDILKSWQIMKTFSSGKS